MKKYTHYGHSSFDIEKFDKITNQIGIPKPQGGLWASPDDADYSWLQWSKDNNMDIDITTSFSFTLKEDANVLVIDNVEVLEGLPKGDNGLPISLDMWTYLDYEKLAGIYDAIEVVISDDHRLYQQLYTWDCDSILIINPSVIEIIN